MKAFFALALMLLSSGTLAESGNVNNLNQDYLKIDELRVQLYLMAHKEFGEKIRASAILEACGKQDLAERVMPTDEEIGKFLSEKLTQAGTQATPAAEVLNKRNREMMFHLLKLSYFQLVFYGGGYQEAVKSLKLQAPSVCAAAEKLAKKFGVK